MAIEFSCPYCTAVIRVPDTLAGQPGRCPQCETTMLVPVPAGWSPQHLNPAPAAENVTSAEPVDLLGLNTPAQTPSSPVPTGQSEGLSALSDLPAGPSRTRVGQQRSRTGAAKPGSPRLRRGRPGPDWRVPAVFLALFGAMGGAFYWWQTAPKPLVGELVARATDDSELGTKRVSRAFGGTAPNLTEVLTACEETPFLMASNLMVVTVTGQTSGWEVQLRRGKGGVLYKIDLTQHTALSEFRQRESERLEDVRLTELTAATSQFLQEFEAMVKQAASRTEHRDRFALTALVDGFGNQLLAVVEGKGFRCVYAEDNAIYFILPAQVKEFELRGQAASKGELLVPAVFTVKVAKSPAPVEARPTPQQTPKDTGSKDTDDAVPAMTTDHMAPEKMAPDEIPPAMQ